MPRLLTPEEIAEILLVSLARSAAGVARARLPAVKVGRQWRVSTDVLAERYGSLVEGPAPLPGGFAEADLAALDY